MLALDGVRTPQVLSVAHSEPAPTGKAWEGFCRALDRAQFAHKFQGDPLRGLPAETPRSVEACLRGAWSFLLLDWETGQLDVRRFRCKSWRCPDCRYQVAKGDFARILAGLESRTARGRRWVLLTLTFDPKRWKHRWEAYRAATRLWQRARARLARRYGSRIRPAKIEYVAVWEQHRSGWPHVHMAVSCPELVHEIEALGRCERHEDGCGPTRKDLRSGKILPNWAWKRRVLDPILGDVGFGRISDVQFARSGDGGVAGYFAKLAAELCGVFDQRPASAPRNFRRLRASRRLLPPRRRSETMTGRLLKMSAGCATKHLDRISIPAPDVFTQVDAWRRALVQSAAGNSTIGASDCTRPSARAESRAPP